MNFELVKELKDAGFPQRASGNFISPPDIEIINSPFAIYLPTLSELIEACGDRFVGLSHYSEGEYTNGWFASAFLKSIDSFPTVLHGETPEQAVAKLWLTLNSR